MELMTAGVTGGLVALALALLTSWLSWLWAFSRSLGLRGDFARRGEMGLDGSVTGWLSLRFFSSSREIGREGALGFLVVGVGEVAELNAVGVVD